ncbi:hypothetical protein DENSPDRAFT_699600 [Dentipellis sp. KUC8613]|nr:hypothetical protein DENSPDRAFT_699600 [Dentipellis sp. KUC8613]
MARIRSSASKYRPPIARTSGRVNRLTNELLRSIFLQCILDDPSNEDYYDYTNIVSIAHVCRRWQIIAIACAHLWCRLDTSMSEQTAFWFLKNANCLPLQVVATCEEGSTDMSAPVRAVLYLADRIEFLHIYGSGDFAHILTYIRGAATHLRLLVIENTEDTFKSVELPATAFGADVPALRHVRLDDAAVIPQPTSESHFWTDVLNELETFELSMDFYEPYDMSMKNLLSSAFEEMISLKSLRLTLDASSEDVFVECALPHKRPTLDDLDFLFLKAPAWLCLFLLGHLEIPSSAAVQIVCTDVSDASPASLHGLMWKLGIHLTRHQSHLRSVLIDESSSPEYKIVGWSQSGRGLRGTSGQYDELEPDAPAVNVGLRWPSKAEDAFPEVMHTFSEMIVPFCMDTLTIRLCTPTEVRWRYFMHKVPNVQTLKIYCNCAMQGLLARILDSGDPCETGLLRCLTRVWVVNDGKAPKTDDCGLADTVGAFVKARGQTLKSLVFEGFSSAFKERISQCAGKCTLEWRQRPTLHIKSI